SVRAQSASTPTDKTEPSGVVNAVLTSDKAEGTKSESGILQTGCSSCGGPNSGGKLCGPGELGSGGCGSCCVPGRNYCCTDCDECTSKCGKFLCGFYHCLCCPD